MYQVLYRKWRPKTFSDVSGQSHIIAALQNEIREGRPAHAYLFIGSRGTGKTSCAKILAKAVNCLDPQNGDPCNACDNCRGIDDGSILDVVEIDAASNNGVDNIRELREAVNFTPAVAKYRVYIIDEVHMLSDGAFNALLKTLEEPPPHVIFILATTEAHKMPATILSRCQRFDFARIAPEDIAARLKAVAAGENFSITDDAAMLLARLADGAMRDALSLTDQCLSRSRDINTDLVAEATGLAGREHLYQLSDAVRRQNSGDALAIIDRLYNASQDMARLCTEWLEFYRELMLCKSVLRPQDIIIATDAELERLKQEAEQYSLPAVLYGMETLQNACRRLQSGADRRLETEMAALRLTTPALDNSTEALIARIEQLEATVRRLSSGAPVAAQTSAPPQETPAPSAPPAVMQTPTPPTTAPTAPEAPTPTAPTAPAAPSPDRPFTGWTDVLEKLQATCAPMFSVLQRSSAMINDTHVTILTDHPLFFELVKGGTNKAALSAAITDVTGKRYRIRAGAPKTPAAEPTADDPFEAMLRNSEQNGIPVQRQ